jgi:D-alanyl-D-alanine carboxypeptidase (penicillin-binding protein 5/6)
MTLLLIFDALKAGKIQMTDQVTTSAYAKSMGGSQVFLEEGEVQTVETLIKCIVIASGNDASVAMAEYISGTEEAFVEEMNKRAEGLGMTNTHFSDCCGLTEDPDHLTTARDIALMTRELINCYPEIHNYSTIWMENITHTTAKGSSEFGLTNTNKLIKHYQYATGLKTGFTNTAMYCISATAKKDDMELIAVIMGAPDIKSRSADATTLLNYGFGKCRIYCDSHEDKLDDLPVEKGLADSVGIIYQRPFQYMTTDGSDLTGITKSIELPENVTAPVKKGNTAGKAVYSLNGTPIGSVNIVYADTVDAADYKDYFCRTLLYFVP